MFLGEKLMFILADFRKNNICGVKIVTVIYRRTTTFYRSYMAGYCDASKLKEARNWGYKNSPT